MLESSSLPILAISGPTASGKSSLAVELALKLNAEIINADSVQLYQGFKIGSGAIREEEMRGVSHHFLNEFLPTDELDIYKFSSLAKERIKEIQSRGKLPILVGGSGLYLEALFCGLVKTPKISEKTNQIFEEKVKELQISNPDNYVLSLHEWLESVDKKSADKINNRDISRIQRALLVYIETGKSLSLLQDESKNSEDASSLGSVLIYVLKPERDVLYEKINLRVEQMFEQGLLGEVEKLYKKFPDSRALGALGYRHVAQYLNSELSLDEVKTLIKRDTRHFAKRQSTWWKNRPTKLNWSSFELPKFLDLFNSQSVLKNLDVKDTYDTWKKSAFEIDSYVFDSLRNKKLTGELSDSPKCHTQIKEDAEKVTDAHNEIKDDSQIDGPSPKESKLLTEVFLKTKPTVVTVAF